MSRRLAAVSAVLALGAQSAEAADRCAPTGAAANISTKAFDRGKREAPALLAAAGVRCDMTEATYLGHSDTAVGGKGPKLRAQLYEVACKEDLGWVVIARPDSPPSAVDCLLARGTGEFACVLPQNFQAGGDLNALLMAAGAVCLPTRAAYLGELPDDRRRRYEAICHDGSALVLDVSTPRDGRSPQVANCLHPDVGRFCKLASREHMVSAVARASAKAVGETCRISDARLIGRVATRATDLYELACGAEQAGVLVEIGDGAVKGLVLGLNALLASGCQATSLQRVAAEPGRATVALEVTCDPGKPAVRVEVPADPPPRVTPCAEAGRYRTACALKGSDAIGLQLAAARNPDASDPLAVREDLWVRKPNAEAMRQYYPVKALDRGIKGGTTLLCAALADGALGDCRVSAESPMGWGFGEATMKFADRFQMRMDIIDASPVAGSLVTVPIRFGFRC